MTEDLPKKLKRLYELGMPDIEMLEYRDLDRAYIQGTWLYGVSKDALPAIGQNFYQGIGIPESDAEALICRHMWDWYDHEAPIHRKFAVSSKHRYLKCDETGKWTVEAFVDDISVYCYGETFIDAVIAAREEELEHENDSDEGGTAVPQAP